MEAVAGGEGAGKLLLINELQVVEIRYNLCKYHEFATVR